MKTLATTHLRQTTMVKVLSLSWEWLLGPQCVTSARAATTAYILREIRVCCCNKVMWGSTLVISNLRERWRHLVTTPGGQKQILNKSCNKIYWTEVKENSALRECSVKLITYHSDQASRGHQPAAQNNTKRGRNIVCLTQKCYILQTLWLPLCKVIRRKFMVNTL